MKATSEKLKVTGTALLGLIGLFAIATFFLTQPGTSIVSATPMSGLVALKSMAQQSVAYESAIANQKPTLIEFYADWCTTCQALAPTLQALHQQFAPQVNFVMLDIDEPQWAEQVRQFQVRGVPQLALLDTHQAVIQTFVGKVPKSVLANLLTELTN
ncbi:MAG: thioredoxin domain-containing protein [Almyronema sp.]